MSSALHQIFSIWTRHGCIENKDTDPILHCSVFLNDLMNPNHTIEKSIRNDFLQCKYWKEHLITDHIIVMKSTNKIVDPFHFEHRRRTSIQGYLYIWFNSNNTYYHSINKLKKTFESTNTWRALHLNQFTEHIQSYNQ